MADNNDGDGGRWQRQTTKAADNNGTQDWAADYKGEGGEQAANTNSIRQKAKPARQRVWKNNEIQFKQKDFFQKYGLSRWIFCSRKDSQCALLILSVLGIWRGWMTDRKLHVDTLILIPM